MWPFKKKDIVICPFFDCDFEATEPLIDDHGNEMFLCSTHFKSVKESIERRFKD